MAMVGVPRRSSGASAAIGNAGGMALALTVLWAALLTAAVLLRFGGPAALRQLASALAPYLALAGAASGAIALALLPAAGWLVRPLGVVLLAAGAVLTVSLALPSFGVYWFLPLGPFAMSEEFALSNRALIAAPPLVLATGILLVTRRSYVRLKGTPRPLAALFRAVFLYFRQQHAWFAWMLVAVIAAHSLFFLLHPGAFRLQLTGIAALALLALLVLTGIAVRGRKRRLRQLHTALTLAFLAALGLHVPRLLVLVGASGVLLTALGGATLFLLWVVLALRGRARRVVGEPAIRRSEHG